MTYKGIILAAGRGSRMKSLTEEHPKCMVHLDGKMLLEWQEEAIQAAGINDIVVIGGYNADKLPNRFETLCNTRWSETNMVSSLLVANDILEKKHSIISYSDIVYSHDHIQRLKECDGDICITYDALWYELWSQRFENPLDDAETFIIHDNILQEIGSKTDSLEDIQGQYMGLLKFTPKGWSQVQSILQKLTQDQCDKLDMTSLLSLILQKNIKISTVQVLGKWCEVDSDTDLEIYTQLLQHKWSHNWKS